MTATRPGRRRTGLGLSLGGPLLLLMAKLADAATTWIGLSMVGLHEANPLVAAVIGEVGLGVALVGVGLAGVAAIVLAVELGVLAVARWVRRPRRAARWLRGSVYVPLALLWLGVAGWNALAIGRALDPGMVVA